MDNVSVYLTQEKILHSRLTTLVERREKLVRVCVRLNDVFSFQFHSRSGNADGEEEDGPVSS